MAVARSSSGSVAIRYVFPVSWMTSTIHTIRQWARIKHDVICLEAVRQVAVPVGRQRITVFR